MVRGHAARVTELYKNKNANVDWRSVRWEEPLKNGGVLQWSIDNDPNLYTRQETIDFINGLVSSR